MGLIDEACVQTLGGSIKNVKILGNAKNRTQGTCLRSTEKPSVLCLPPHPTTPRFLWPLPRYKSDLVSDDPPLRVQDEVEGVALPEVEAVGEDDVQGEAEDKVLDFIGMASNVYANKLFKEQESSTVSVF